MKIKMYGTGRAYDNTVSILINIADLDPAYITVKTAEAPPAALNSRKSTK